MKMLFSAQNQLKKIKISVPNFPEGFQYVHSAFLFRWNSDEILMSIIPKKDEKHLDALFFLIQIISTLVTSRFFEYLMSNKNSGECLMSVQ